MKQIVIILALGALLMGVIYLIWYRGIPLPWKTNTSPIDPYYVRGVDVSHHQGEIDWADLAGHDVTFTYIKATEGGDWVDPRFHENWRQSERMGMKRGAYHFFTLCRDASAQAAHFLDTVGDMTGALVPVLDAEHMGPCKENAPMRDVAGGVLTFLDEVHRAIGVRPVIYTNKVFYTAHLEGKTPGERFWLRSILRPPTYGPENWLFWQYSDNGRRRGIDGPVDLNVFAGEGTELTDLLVR